MRGEDVRSAAAALVAFVTGLRDADPDLAAVSPVVGLPVRGVVGHIATTLLWYATDLAAGPDQLDTMQLELSPEATGEDLLRTLGSFAEVLAATVDAAAPTARGFHGWGTPDPDGFAAIGVAEILLHGSDISAASPEPFGPDPALAAAVRDRLFPAAPTNGDPWVTLLWATGRGDLPGRERVAAWQYHPAPR